MLHTNLVKSAPLINRNHAWHRWHGRSHIRYGVRLPQISNIAIDSMFLIWNWAQHLDGEAP